MKLLDKLTDKFEGYVGKINYVESRQDLRYLIHQIIQEAERKGLSGNEIEDFVHFILEFLLEHEKVDGPFPWCHEFEEAEPRDAFFTSFLEFAQEVARRKYGLDFQFVGEWEDLESQGYIAFITHPQLDCVKTEFYSFTSVESGKDLAVFFLPLWQMLRKNRIKEEKDE